MDAYLGILDRIAVTSQDDDIPEEILLEYDRIYCFDRQLRRLLGKWPCQPACLAMIHECTELSDVDKRLFLRTIASKLDDSERLPEETQQHLALWRMEWVEKPGDLQKEVGACNALIQIFRKERDYYRNKKSDSSHKQLLPLVAPVAVAAISSPPKETSKVIEGYVPHQWIPMFDN